ncbi:MAG: carboxypeptidase-like regulatory domain-containing protein, partial [Candidatus Hatepunaea meridiana]|nr:carboxypeptidase-like regulatory domain-containing protein [Candidatus Hatepunaea meridiana]
MNNYHKTFLSIALLICFLYCFPAIAEITVNPIGFAISVEEDQGAEVELVLSNSSEDDVAFSIDYELVEDDDDRRAGPRRDDPGEILQRIQTPYIHWIGMAWDPENNWLWGCNYTESFRIMAYDPEDDEVHVNFDPGRNLVGMYYYDGIIHAGGYSQNQNTIYRYDLEGNALDNMRSPVALTSSCIAAGDEYLFTLQINVGGIIRVWDIEDLEQVGTINYWAPIANNAQIYGMEWIDNHPDGQLWLARRDDTRLYQLFVDGNWDAEVVQSFQTPQLHHCGLAHDGEDLWMNIYNNNDRTWYRIDDGVEEFHMLIIEPETGVVPGEDAETVDIHIVTEGCEAGVYNMLVQIELTEPEEERDDFEETTIRISGVVSIDSPTAGVSGTVTNTADNEVIEGAFIELDCYIIGVYSDEDGNYALSNLPAGEYELTFSAPDFLPTTEAVNLGEDDVELNIELLYAEFLSDEDQFFMALEPDMEHTFEFEVSNGGNGPLTYLV